MEGYVQTETILGAGGFGEVRLGRDVKNDRDVAIKRVPKKDLTASLLEHLRLETKIFRECSHEGVVRLLDVLEEENDLYFIMEYLSGGDLFDFITDREGGAFDAEELKLFLEYFRQIVEAVGFLHQRDIVHHDIKLENVLLDASRTRAKLIDFGFCCVQRSGETLGTFSGSEPYCPPELLEGNPYCGKAVDVYCLGVVLYLLLCRAYPFNIDDMDERYLQQTNYDYVSSLSFPAHVPKMAKDLVLLMLEPNPKARPTVAQIREHPFFLSLQPRQQQPQQQQPSQQQQQQQDGASCETPRRGKKRSLDLARSSDRNFFLFESTWEVA